MRISLGQFGWADRFTGPDLGPWHWFSTGVGRSCALFLPLPSFPFFPRPSFPVPARGTGAQAQGTLDPGAWVCPPRFDGNWSGTASTLAPAIWHLGYMDTVGRKWAEQTKGSDSRYSAARCKTRRIARRGKVRVKYHVTQGQSMIKPPQAQTEQAWAMSRFAKSFCSRYSLGPT